MPTRPPRAARGPSSRRCARYWPQALTSLARMARIHAKEKRIEATFETTGHPEIARGYAASPTASDRRWSEERRMRDSNSPGVAPDTLSNNADRRLPEAATVRDQIGRAHV